MHVPGGLVCALIVSVLGAKEAPPGDPGAAVVPRPRLALAPTSDASATPVAGSARGSAVLDQLVLAGEASGDTDEVIRRAVTRGLGGEGVRMIERPAGAAPGPCTSTSCAAGLAAASKSDYVVGGRIEVSERNYDLTLELHDGRDGRVVATRSASCPICSMPEVEAAAAKAAAELAAEFSPRVDATLSITSCPNGAAVYIDGALAGETPFTGTAAPGEHRIEVKSDGYMAQERTIAIEPGVAPDPVSFALLPKKAGSPSSVMMPLGWVAVGLGAASFITGVALLAIDEKPFKAYCEGDNVDPFGRCRFQYNTLGGGVTGLVVGAALVGGGAALLVLDRKRRGPGPTKAAAQLRFGVHPRGLSLTARF